MSGSPRQWTAQQRRAIELFGGDVLVTASAGTGKTSVLVERVLRLVRDPGAGVDIDRLLVVTFTRAAAAEMRRRIAEGLAGRTSADAAGLHIRRQRVLLDRAAIGTLHAFCGRIVREHYRELGLDPNFRVLSADEARRMRLVVAGEVFESSYATAGDPGRAFHAFADAYSPPMSDEPLLDAVLDLDEFLSALPDPANWIARAAGEAGDCAALPGEAALRAMLQRELRYIAAAAERLPRHDSLTHFADSVQRVMATAGSAGIDEVLRALADLDMGRRSGDAGAADADARTSLAELRERLTKLQGRFIGATAAGYRRDLAAVADHSRTLLETVTRFRTQYTAGKRARHVLDFADLERESLRLLTAGDGGDSPAARRLRERYEYVFVDEYQDISPLQDAVLNRLSRPAGNRFLVGDVKQSIYGFRQADPSLFLTRLDACSPSPPAGTMRAARRVDLTGNFRSAPGIVDAVNALMERLMVPGLGGVPYDEAAQLTFAGGAVEISPGAPPFKAPAVEMHLVDSETGSEAACDNEASDEPADPTAASSAAREAGFVAERIRRMVTSREFSVRDAAGAHPVEWRDIAVLLRGLRGRADVYADALSRADIPVIVPRPGGEPSVELRDVVNLLRTLDNPRQDLPLIGLLRSPLIGLHDSDLANLRLGAPEAGVWDALRAAGGSGAQRANSAVAHIDAWRNEARLATPADVLARVFRDTGYPAYVCGLPSGRRRLAELLGLVDRVRRIQSRSAGGMGLTELAGILSDSGDDDSDLGPPASSEEDENAVRILTIHRSKGLEFPVVFLPDLGRRFNLREIEGDVLWSRAGGLGLTVIDRAAGKRRATLTHGAIADSLLRESLAEELRLLYVGVTRARDALVLSAAGSPHRDLPKWSRRRAAAGPLPEDVLAAARCPADWVFPAAMSAGQKLPAVQVQRPADRISTAPVVLGSRSEAATDVGSHSPDAPVSSPARITGKGCAAVTALLNRLEWRYPHDQLAIVPAQRSVAQMTGARVDRVERPRFLLAEAMPPAPSQLSAAYRRLVGDVDLGGQTDEIQFSSLLDRLIEVGRISAEVGRSVEPAKLAEFFQSEPGRLLRTRPADVRRNVAVEFTIAAGEIAFDLPPADAAEPVAVRGAIGVLVPGPAGFRLLEFAVAGAGGGFSTGRIERFRARAALQRRAVRAIWDRDVERATLCLLDAGTFVDA